MIAVFVKTAILLCVRTPVIIQFGVSSLQTGVGAKVGADYVNHLRPSFFAEYIQLYVVLWLRYRYTIVAPLPGLLFTPSIYSRITRLQQKRLIVILHTKSHQMRFIRCALLSHPNELIFFRLILDMFFSICHHGVIPPAMCCKDQ